jgi:hypothetical protein
MSHKVITYTLTPEGKIPEFIKKGGYYENNGVLIGVTNSDYYYDAINVFNNVDELEAYLRSYIVNHDYDYSLMPSFEGNPVPFNYQVEAANIFEIINF